MTDADGQARVSGSHWQLAELLAQLRHAPGVVESLPGAERDVVWRALEGASISEIAGVHAVSEAAVWSILSNAARFASGHAPVAAVETGGLGSDTDPGVTGGYGDTGFGSLGNAPPEPLTEEPDEGDTPA
jgi:DNA-binding CsgD family transcriptional regulator